jgi:hypothetical protein
MASGDNLLVLCDQAGPGAHTADTAVPPVKCR